MDFKAFKHWFKGHEGPIIAVAPVEVTDKKNTPEKVQLKAIPVRKCEVDGEIFSTPEDILGMMQ